MTALAAKRNCGPNRPEIVTVGAVPHVELVADDRKPHWVCTEQELAISDRVRADIGGNVAGAPTVPAGAVPGLRIGRGHFACWGT